MQRTIRRGGALAAASLVLALLSAPAAGTGSSFAATTGDPTVRALVARWTAANGSALAWNAGFDLPIRDARALNQAAGLAQARDLPDAVARLLVTLNEEVGRAVARPAAGEPLRGCFYKGNRTVLVVPMRAACTEKSSGG